MTKLEKFKKWFKSAGIRSALYLVAGFIALIVFKSWLLFGVGLGIFLADNWVTIKKLD